MMILFALLLELLSLDDLVTRATREKKPIVVFHRPAVCERCDEFERALAHPTIERRMPNVVFATLPGDEAGIAFYDRSGTMRARWPIVPDTMNLGIILDSVVAVAPHFERALERSGAEADLEIGTGLARLARMTDARAAFTRAREQGSGETRLAATVALAVLDANEGKVAEATRALEQVLATAEAASPARAEAQRAVDALRTKRVEHDSRAIRILPLSRQVVSGRETVRTRVASAAIARVAFSLDGRVVARVDKPPFSATLDFGAIPERHSIRATAFDRSGKEIARDERIVNEAGETFWLRLTSPRDGLHSGAVRVTMNVRAPSTHRVRRVVVSWNDAERAVLTEAPWEAVVRIPAEQMGVLRAVAELDDGRTSEDAALLNALGGVEHVNVQLVELPITISGANEITPERITVREGNKVRRIESVATAAETPLTVGLLVDVSDSMQKTLPDVQEAAIRFLDNVLGDRDRAFLITFDSRARLVQPATSDRARLRSEIVKIRPDGLTSLHDAMVLGLLQFEGIKGRRAMIVFSDGLDRTSQYTAADVRELARRMNVPIHIILVVPPEPAPEYEELKRMPATTGGTSHVLEELAALPNAYARIQAALAAQVLAFMRTDPATRENEWRSIRVEVKGDALEVHAPEGYYASW